MNIIKRIFSKPNKSLGGSTIYEYSEPKNSPKTGFSGAPAEWQEQRENHYRKWLGDSEDNIIWHEILPFVPHVDVHIFPPSNASGRNYYTLITSGMSDEKMNLPHGVDKDYARAEILFYIANDETKKYQTEKPWYVEAINFFAHFPFEYKTWLAYSHTLPNGNPAIPVVEGSTLSTALFLPAIFEPKEFTQDFRLSGEKVNFLWLTFLNDRETEFKLKFGYDKLVEKFNKDNFPQVFNPFRPSIV
jgi:hypothetical protein